MAAETERQGAESALCKEGQEMLVPDPSALKSAVHEQQRMAMLLRGPALLDQCDQQILLGGPPVCATRTGAQKCSADVRAKLARGRTALVTARTGDRTAQTSPLASGGEPAVDQQRGETRQRQHQCTQPQPTHAGVTLDGLVADLLLQGRVHGLQLGQAGGVVRIPAGEL